jgi:hypothetical protein
MQTLNAGLEPHFENQILERRRRHLPDEPDPDLEPERDD